MFDWQHLPPIIPVFVNCAAAPRPPLARVFAFGRALGAFAASLNCRVLLTASGGISLDPPIPTLDGAPEPVREHTPLNPVWDQSFLKHLRDDNQVAILAMDAAAASRDGGCGGHEIRTWIALAAGVRQFDLRYYRAIPQWLAGYAVMTANAA